MTNLLAVLSVILLALLVRVVLVNSNLRKDLAFERVTLNANINLVVALKEERDKLAQNQKPVFGKPEALNIGLLTAAEVELVKRLLLFLGIENKVAGEVDRDVKELKASIDRYHKLLDGIAVAIEAAEDQKKAAIRLFDQSIADLNSEAASYKMAITGNNRKISEFEGLEGVWAVELPFADAT